MQAVQLLLQIFDLLFQRILAVHLLILFFLCAVCLGIYFVELQIFAEQFFELKLPRIAAVFRKHGHLFFRGIDEPAVHDASDVAERGPAGYHPAEHGSELRILPVGLQHQLLHVL